MEQKQIKKISYTKGGILFTDDPEVWINPHHKDMIPEIQNLREGDIVDIEVNERDRYTYIKRAADSSEKIMGLPVTEPKGVFDGLLPDKPKKDEFMVINEKLDRILKAVSK